MPTAENSRGYATAAGSDCDMPHMIDSRRARIEVRLVERWRACEESVVLNQRRAASEYGHDVCFYIALLLNTFLDADDVTDWRGTWADRLIDEKIEYASSGTRSANGLMVFGTLGVSGMHVVPFAGNFVWSANATRPKSYELCFAAAGPWNRAGAPLILPYTRDGNVRQKLLNRKEESQESWATVYHSP